MNIFKYLINFVLLYVTLFHGHSRKYTSDESDTSYIRQKEREEIQEKNSNGTNNMRLDLFAGYCCILSCFFFSIHVFLFLFFLISLHKCCIWIFLLIACKKQCTNINNLKLNSVIRRNIYLTLKYELVNTCARILKKTKIKKYIMQKSTTKVYNNNKQILQDTCYSFHLIPLYWNCFLSLCFV